MIELCDIFSLDSPAKQQVLFVKQPFNLSSFRAIFGHAIFYGSLSDSLKFSVSLSAWRVTEVFSHSLISNKNCLLWTSYWISRFSFWQCLTKSNQLTITWHIDRPPYLYFDKNRSSTFLFTSKGLTLEGFTTFMDCCLMSLGMRWIISEASIEWQQRRMHFAELHSSQWLSCRILNTPALNIWM